ncbi:MULTISPECIES: hypothetical protein [Brevibacillus]|uniref:hypothetical protein n=1 Tax=Brevibacillus TaxID=55080 RepID=UPI00203C3881|nr:MULTISPECIES: hypothetical protein [Brevibacillus]MCM3081726.1 hypothetical protein [Brevibacillus invocatus]MCM3432134.1 hypothetical protein [Brevibacillus invocatus]MDH4615593.1 hypothetical protein [Brevibacillus sp. AY1]
MGRLSIVLELVLVTLLLIGCEERDSMSSHSIVDRDMLVEQFHLIHDFNSGEEFNTEELKSIQTHTQRSNYKLVLLNFFTHQLKQDIESFQTINEIDNIRHILVLTKENFVYRVDLKQWREFNNIWTVDMYGNAPLSIVEK